MSELSKPIEMTQSNRVYETVIVTGDFNFKNLTWDQGMIQIDQIQIGDYVVKLQQEVNYIYNLADNYDMNWKNLKFQLFRFGYNERLREDTLIFSPNYKSFVERTEVVKYLGILVDDPLSYKQQKQKVLAMTRAKIG